MKTALLTALAAAASFAQPVTYDIDSAHSSAQFSVRHMMISNVKGEFAKVTGTITYDPKNVAASKVEAVIDTNSINTREAKRDAHLKSPDFFDTAKYPTITFSSKQVWSANGKLHVKGDLTMHGVTKEAVLTLNESPATVKDQRGSVRLGAEATTQINRKDWGIVWNRAVDGGGVVVSDQVTITLDIEAVQKAPAKTTN